MKITSVSYHVHIIFIPVFYFSHIFEEVIKRSDKPLTTSVSCQCRMISTSTERTESEQSPNAFIMVIPDNTLCRLCKCGVNQKARGNIISLSEVIAEFLIFLSSFENDVYLLETCIQS